LKLAACFAVASDMIPIQTALVSLVIQPAVIVETEAEKDARESEEIEAEKTEELQLQLF
jgi:hypothetical protein